MAARELGASGSRSWWRAAGSAAGGSEAPGDVGLLIGRSAVAVSLSLAAVLLICLFLVANGAGAPAVVALLTAGVALVALLLVLLRRAVLAVRRWEQNTPKDVLDGVASRVLPATSREIEREVARCRRHLVPLSVAVLHVEGAARPGARGRELWDEVARRLHSEVRRIDLVAHDSRRGRFVVVAPHTEPQQVQALLTRISRSFEQRLGLRLGSGVASLPRDALLWEDLVEEADRRSQNGRSGAVAATVSSVAGPADRTPRRAHDDGRAAS